MNSFLLDTKTLPISNNKFTKAEKELEHQKNIFRYIMENSESISVQGYNENREVIYWNRASETIYGYTKEEALGQKLEELIIPNFMKNAVIKGIKNWIQYDIPIPSSELTLQAKNGKKVTVFSQHVMIQVDTEHKEMYCLDIDLKEIKKLQYELNLEKNFLNIIFDVIPDLVWLKDPDGVYLKCNHMFELFYGAKEEQIIGKTDFDFVDTELAEFFREHDALAIKAKKPAINEEYLTFSDHSHDGLYETIKIPMKSNEGELVGVLGIARDISERKAKEQKLQQFANYDTLTGLTNRNLFMDRLTQLLSRRDTTHIYHALLFIDLDRFKEINDTLGHSIGDKLLIMVAKRLQSITREEDTLSRLGGDEFTVILKNLYTTDEASIIAQKILDIMTKPFNIDNYELYITLSIGIAISPNDSNSTESLLKYADTAMYKAKEKGRNTYEYYTKELSLKATKRMNIVNDLRNALKNSNFELYYQVQTDAKRQKSIGAEALIRWNHPQKGLVSPIDFIPIAESSGQIVEIGQWVIYQAMKDIVEWKKDKNSIFKISVNLSVKQLSSPFLLSDIKKMLQKTSCKAQWIEFEITESYMMNNPKKSILLLNQLVDLGFTLSIDDFGTGYSSLSYLTKLPISKLKIDKSFVDDISTSSDDKAIIKSIILIAQSMNLEVIAEGVETNIQQEILLEQGCYLTQGYLYSKPIPKKEFELYLKNH